jgi:hypothetical protein
VRLRFSLRVMCAVMTAIAVFCGWRMQPGRTATSFRDAFNRGNFALALQMVDTSALTPSEKMRFEEVFRRIPGEAVGICSDPTITLIAFDSCEPKAESSVTIHPQRWWDWLGGRCEGNLWYRFEASDAFYRMEKYDFNFVARGNRIVVTEEVCDAVCQSSS